MNSFCIRNCLACKGPLPWFKPIWSIFAGLPWRQNFNEPSWLDFYWLVNIFVLSPDFNSNTSENCKQVTIKSKMNIHVYNLISFIVHCWSTDSLLSFLTSEFMSAPGTPPPTCLCTAVNKISKYQTFFFYNISLFNHIFKFLQYLSQFSPEFVT